MPPAIPSYRAPELPEELGDVRELAMDLRLSTMHVAQAAWRYVDPDLWHATRNPWLILQTISDARLRELAADTSFVQLVHEGLRQYRERLEAPTWFQVTHPHAPLTGVIYLSLEFGLTDALPIYSGGLGNVAGDQLKSASDLGVPVTGVGLLYQQGYFRQTIDAGGAQREFYPYNDPGQLPIRPVYDADGWVRIAMRLPGRVLWLRAWVAHVGRVRLYLLDSNDPANSPADRGITAELYGGGLEQRLWQEVVLGLGGWRLVRRLALAADVCHLNEGHAAFAVLERARSFMKTNDVPFDVALTATRAGNVFTTHTPVEAGFDRFPMDLVRHALGGYCTRLGIGVEQLMSLGRMHPDAVDEPLNMAYLAIRGSGAVNGVSRLHGAVSRSLFEPLFPRWPTVQVPVGHVTNGVHVQSWVSTEANALWLRSCGDGYWTRCSGDPEPRLAHVPDEELWQCRTTMRARLVRFVRYKLASQLASAGVGSDGDRPQPRDDVFDPNVLTLGFARRFAVYKRPSLLLHDPERLARLLTDSRRPVQIVVAGKAHPRDEAGKAMVQRWVTFSRRPDVRRHAVFLADYDITLAEHLVEGVDVWINTPRRPWEASGTSGMKVLGNGGLNCSELDGWWAEAWSDEVGWAIGDGLGDDDAAEAERLYTLLERDVVPRFYDRDSSGIPRRWVATMRESMLRLTPRFSSSRTVREYTERYYLTAAAAYRRRAADGGILATDLRAWHAMLERGWHTVRLGGRTSVPVDDGSILRLAAYLGDVSPDAVAVQLYADPPPGEDTPRIVTMTREAPLTGAANGFVYAARLPAGASEEEWTARVVAAHPDAIVPLEAAHVLWEE